jgi:PAS domain S-box-containing protein
MRWPRTGREGCGDSAPRLASAAGFARTYFLAACLFITIAFISIALIRDLAIQKRLFEIHDLEDELTMDAGKIIHLDEVLTMSAKMAAATGDSGYEARYKSFEPQLDAAIKRVMSIGRRPGMPDTAKLAESVDAANGRLVRMEHESFAMASRGEPSSALALLDSSAYRADKEIYAKNITDILRIFREDCKSDYRQLSAMRSRQFVLYIIGAALLFLMWAGMIGSIHKAARYERGLKGSHEHLEKAVGERTAMVSELKRRMEFVLGATKTGLDIIDSEYNIVYIDPEWQKAYGDPKGRKCYEYFMDRPEVCPGCGVTKAFATKETVVTEEVLAKEGNRPIQVTTIPFRDGAGKWFVAEVNVDITERRKTDEILKEHRDNLQRLVDEQTEAIRETTSRFRTLFEEASDGILVADPGTRRFSMCNKAISEMLGYGREELLEMSVDDIHPRESLPYVLEQFRRQASGEIRLAASLPVKRRDGSIFFADVTVSHLMLDGKKAILGSFRDITERKRSEEALAMSEASYRAIFESANDAIIVRDIDTYQILEVNKRAGEIFCCPPDELIGTLPDKLLTDSAEYSPERIRELFDGAAKGEHQLFEWLARDYAGRQFWVEINVRRAVIRGGFRLLSVVRDITDRKRAMELKNEFMNTVSHELRTPLGIIKESVALVLDGKVGGVNAKQAEMLEMAKHNVDRLTRLINQVLDFQKLDAGKMEFRFEEGDINAVVEEVYRHTRSLVSKKKLKYEFKPDPALPKVRFDRDRIAEVLTNLVSNAIKATDRGGIAIKTFLEGARATVSISDTGHGIKEKDMPRLFERFAQLERKPGGTGLGLAICKEIVEAHKGEIRAESQWGKGSTFTFTLPI